MNYTVCLVIINDPGGRPVGAESSSVIANRFRCRHIREFDIIPAGHRSLGEGGLQKRAEHILQELVADSQLALGKNSSTERDTLLFFGHGLGGLLVQQIVLLAATSSRYQIVSQSIDLLVFIGTPHRTNSTSLPSQSIFHILASSRIKGINPVNLLSAIQSELPSLEDEFPIMLRNRLSIVNFIERSTTDDGPGVIPNEYCSTMGVPREENIRLACSYSELWTTVVTNEMAVDTIIKKLEQAVGAKPKVKRTSQWHDFLELLGQYTTAGSSASSAWTRLSASDSVNWVQTTESFTSWMNMSGTSVLHIIGQPGSGTTVLTSHIIDILLSDDKANPVLATFTTTARTTTPSLSVITEMLIALSQQLLSLKPDAFRSCAFLCSVILNNPVHTITETIAWSLLRCALSSIRDSIYFIIQDLDQIERWQYVLLKLSDIAKQGQTLRILVTTTHPLILTVSDSSTEPVPRTCRTGWEDLSRGDTASDSVPNQNLCKDHYFSIHLENQQASSLAIEKAVRERILLWQQEKGLWPDLEEEVLARICIPKTTYLLAAQQMDYLRSSLPRTTKSCLRELLEALPLTYNEMYTQTLESLPQAARDWAMIALAWIVFSIRRLDKDQLALALAFEGKDIQEIETMRQNVSYDIASDLAKVIRPFFKIIGIQVNPIHTDIGNMPSLTAYATVFHAKATVTCLTYLSVILDGGNITGPSGELLDEAMKSKDCSFLSYSVIHWPDHCRIAMSGNDEDFVNSIYILLGKRQLLSTWSLLYSVLTKRRAWEQPIAPLSSGVNVACRFGILPLLEAYFASLEDSPSVGEVWANALGLAAQFGHTDVVSWLLQKGATSADALSLAAAGGHADIVDIFLNRRSDPSRKDSMGYTAILYAAERGHTKVLNRLLENVGQELTNEATPDGLSALHLASRIGYLEGVKRLLVEGGNDMQENESGQIPLHLAAAGGYADVVSAFTLRPELVTKATSAENGARTPLHLAAFGGDAETCQRLLTAGSPSLLQITDKRGWTPLHVASESGNLEVVRLFLDRFDEVNIGNHGAEATEVAKEAETCRSSLSIADTIHDDDQSPEVLAAGNGHVAVMMVLLSRLAQKRQSMDSTVTPSRLSGLNEAHSCLRIAARNGQIGALEQLLKVGVDAASPDLAGNTVLHLAVKANQLMAVEKLLENASPEDKKVALVLAVQFETMDIMHTLIYNGAEVAATNTYACSSPLHAAAEKGNEAIMSELLKMEAGQELFKEVIADLVSLAARNGYVTFVQRLFSLNHELSQSDDSEEEHEKRLVVSLLQVESISNNHEALRTLFEATRRSDSRGYAEKILHVAAERGHSNIIELLVKHSVDVNHKTDSGATPLILAARGGHISACRCLLGYGADVDGTDNETTTALIIACRSGSRELAELFLEFNANINAADRDGEAPLYATTSAPEIMRLLLKRSPKPDTEMRGHNGRTPLLQAAKIGNLNSIDLLLEGNAKINATDDDDNTCLHIAIKNRHFNIVERLVKSDVDCNAWNSSGHAPLHEAAISGLHESFKYLIPKITDINALSRDCGTALAEVPAGAYSYSSTDREIYIQCAEVLINNQADINCYGGTLHSPLQAAVWYEIEELVRLYIRLDAIIDATGGRFTTALNAAVQCNRADLAKILLEAGASPTVELGDGLTILSRAIRDSTDEVVEVLLSSHSQVISADTIYSALRVAAKSDKLNVFKLLAAKDVLVKKASGSPPILFDAISSSGDSVLYYLLGEGKNLINLDETDVHGTTALAYAIAGDHYYVDELLEAGADPNIADDRGNTPLTLAVKASNEGFVQTILSRNLETEKVARLDIFDFAGRGALYWACYSGDEDLFDAIMERLIEQNAKAADYNSAMHAASARNMGNMLMRLFMIGADYTQLDRNNWSLMDTATEYDAISILQLLPTFLEARHQDLQSTVEFERPTSWNKRDMHRQVEISDDGLRMKLKGPVRAAMGRSNFCMPTRTPLYYFEVTIEKLVPRDGNTKPLELGVGFCEEHVALDSMVGWRHGSWGHHLDDGCLYSESGTGKPDPSYTEQYAEGDTIGCGINFRDRTAFFTKNGTFLGNVFSGIRGKLYPAVSFGRNLASDSCIVANFGGDPAVKFKYNPPVSPPDSTSLDLEPAPTRSKATKTKKKSKKFKRTNSLRHDDEA